MSLILTCSTFTSEYFFRMWFHSYRAGHIDWHFYLNCWKLLTIFSPLSVHCKNQHFLTLYRCPINWDISNTVLVVLSQYTEWSKKTGSQEFSVFLTLSVHWKVQRSKVKKCWFLQWKERDEKIASNFQQIEIQVSIFVSRSVNMKPHSEKLFTHKSAASQMRHVTPHLIVVLKKVHH